MFDLCRSVLCLCHSTTILCRESFLSFVSPLVSNLAGTYPGVSQYSYAYGQGYGDYAAYNAYLQQAAYAGYPGQYYQGEYMYNV